ncbi:class I SAM-dependent methyltransferase [Paenibacillus sp. J31TS4]|uniref:class I SAM-dependent methyltransferase n=1 Tax=Paenibacillus sp. J31TS4 TaxID=2807195 RepID=UPI0020BE35C6|nr:methyltransferase domain-containing protein [Paenibacillus sp. J31TS4]
MQASKPVYEQAGFAVTCRSPEEYAAMFALEEPFPAERDVLDVAAGASSYTAEARLHGVRAYAVDPQYAKTPAEMEEFGRREMETAAGKIGRLSRHMDWSFYGSPERQLEIRKRSLERFTADYRKRHEEGETVYRCGGVPNLPFESESFDLVLCSHFLFLYDEQLPYELHAAAVRDMLRVLRSGGEARIYPLVNLRYEPSAFVERLLGELDGASISYRYEPSELPFMPGSDRLLVLQKNRNCGR